QVDVETDRPVPILLMPGDDERVNGDVTEATDRLRPAQIDLLMHHRHDHVPSPVATENLVFAGVHEAEGVEPGVHLASRGLLAVAIDKIATVVAEVVDEVVARGRHRSAK